MGISAYIKEIGRGKDGARSLNREQAADLMGQVLDGQVSDLEIGAFCLAMRIKGETPEEMAGFLDATQQRLHHFESPANQQGTGQARAPRESHHINLIGLNPRLIQDRLDQWDHSANVVAAGQLRNHATISLVHFNLRMKGMGQ